MGASRAILPSLGLTTLAFGLLAFWYFGALSSPNRLMQALHTAAHFPVFGGIALVAWLLLRRHGSTALQRGPRPYLLVLGFMLALSLATEGLQTQLPGRHGSLSDVGVNLLGTIAVLALLALREPRRSYGQRAACIFVALACMVIGLQSAATLGAAYLTRALEFPVLASFDQQLDLVHVEPNGVALRRIPSADQGWPGGGRTALCARLLGGSYPGVMFPDPPRNWEGFTELELELANPGDEPLTLVLRIDDALHDGRHHDRVNHTIILPANVHQAVRIPLEELRSAPDKRELQLHRITRMILFSSAEYHGREFCVGTIRLAGPQR